MFRTSFASQALKKQMFFSARNFSVKVGDALPSAHVSILKHSGDDKGFSNEIVDTQEYFANKSVVIIGIPAAFSPTCQNQMVPDFISNSTKIRSAGIDEVLTLSVNDPFVMTAFGETMGGGEHMGYVADGNGEFTQALGNVLDLSAVQLGHVRSPRFTMIVKNNTIVELNNEGGPAYTDVSKPATVLSQLGINKQ